jgi:hypothetical protein
VASAAGSVDSCCGEVMLVDQSQWWYLVELLVDLVFFL